MLTKKFWLRLLNVDQSEWWVVKNLMMLQFLQGAGIAFFFTASFAGFLDNHPITELPWVMIAASFMLWIGGWLYTKAEHALPFPRLVIGITILMAVSFIVFRLFAYNSQEGLFFYVMLAWFHLLYLLNNLQFWGIATIIFDLRQSKRLFGLISSGDIPAKFVGYTLAYSVIKIVGQMNMLYLGAACLLGSIPFMLRIIRSGKLHIEHHEHHGHHNGHHSLHESVHYGTSKLMTMFKNFMSNSFISGIAFISMLAFIAILILDYGFYAEVKSIRDDENLGAFIAGFMAIMRISALFAKMIFTGRLTNSMGIRQTLLITPLTLAVLTTVIISTQLLTDNQKTLFYEFGAAFIIIDVCRTVFNSPVLLTLMQPLPTHERLRAHNIVKGIMDPFAFLITGLVLFFLTRVARANLLTISYVLVGVCCLWIPGIIFVHRQYLKILVQTISSRYFSQEEFSLKDEAILQAIRKKIESGNDLEVISILKMLHSKKDPVAEDLMVKLLNHPSEQVQLETLRLISGKQRDVIKEKLEQLIAWTNNNDIRDEAIKAFSKTSILPADTADFMEQEDLGIKKAVLCGMLMNGETQIRDLAQQQVEQLIRSQNKLDKYFAAQIMQEVKAEYSHPNLHVLITDVDPQVQMAGIRCIGKAASTLSMHALMEVFPHHSKAGLQALQDAGEKAVGVISEGLQQVRLKNWHEKFILVLGRIGGKQAQEVLVKLLDGEPSQLAPVIRALYRTKYVANEEVQRKMESLARLYLIYGVELLHMQRVMQAKEGYKILARSIDLETQEIRDLLLCLFACMFDRVKMNQARKGLDSTSNENIANAMELIELTVKKDVGRYFNHMFETTSIEHRCDTLRVLLKDVDFDKVEHIVARVLEEKPILYQNWTKACSLYITKKYLFRIEPSLIKKYSEAENRMVRETAVFALANP